MLRKVPSKPSLRSAARALHGSSQKPNPSPLLSTNAQYQAMSVNNLKQELRHRGLPVSGRKALLVERLASNDIRRGFSQTSAPAAKGDESHIDYFMVPEKKAAPAKQKVRIPIVPDNRTVAKDVEIVEPTVPTPDAASTSAAIHSVSGDRPISSMNTDLGDAAAEEIHDDDASPKLPSRDKTILAGIVAGVAALFVGDSWLKKKN